MYVRMTDEKPHGQTVAKELSLPADALLSIVPTLIFKLCTDGIMKAATLSCAAK